jgi:hypothetical protein
MFVSPDFSPTLDSEKLQKQESSLPPEIRQAISKADEIFAQNGEAKKPGSRLGSCGLASELVSYLLRKTNLPNLETIKPVQVWELNAMLRGVSAQDINNFREIIFARDFDEDRVSQIQQEHVNRSFKHACTILKYQNRWYLADITFCQFVDAQKGVLKSASIETPYSLNEPWLKDLYNEGVIELTPQLIANYYSATSSPETIPQLIHLNEEVVDTVLHDLPASSQDNSDEFYQQLVLGQIGINDNI